MICLRQEIHDQLSEMSKVVSSDVTKTKHLPSIALRNIAISPVPQNDVFQPPPVLLQNLQQI